MKGRLVLAMAAVGSLAVAGCSCSVPSGVATDNLANKTRIKLIQGDTQLQPAQATTVTQQFISNSSIVAVVGPAGSQEVGRASCRERV